MINIDCIREKLISAINQSGIKKGELAKKIGVSHQAIGQYLYQNKLPALDTLAKICAVLDLDANEILCVEEYKYDLAHSE